MTKILILGESPNEATAGKPHLWLMPNDSGRHNAARRLLKWSGLSRERYLELFDRDYALRRLPRKKGKGRAFDRRRATRLLQKRCDVWCKQQRRVIVLGFRLAKCFFWYNQRGLRYQGWEGRVPPLTWSRATLNFDPDLLDTFPAAVVPHTSGINLWWNNHDHRAAARRFFEEL